MAKCHNCGRETLRTGDWACQWCGHPLLYGSFKKIEKTYKQLKEERLYKSKGETGLIQEREQEPESERKMEPKQDLELIKWIELEPEPEKVKEAAVAQGIEQETEPVKEPERELEKIEEPESELEAEPTQETEIEEEVGAGPEEEGKQETEVVEESETEEIQKSEPKTEEKVELKEPEPKPEPADIELTVGEILTAYEEDDVAADEKFMNRVLRVTGTVSMIDIKDKLDIHYIRMTGSGGDPWQSLQCMFDKKHSKALEQLEKEQTATVQGRYSGSVIAIRMVDCALVL
jgi:DNA-directed RNA polymerase subunit RPC12/RpoP